MTEDNLERAKASGRATLESIQEDLTALRLAQNAGDDDAAEDCRISLEESALSVEVRNTNWRTLYDKEAARPDEYRILLGWGGPAVQVTGELDENDEPATARLEVQDWFLPWTALELTEEEGDDLLDFARLYYFGE